MNSILSEFSVYCYDKTPSGFFKDFKEDVLDSDNIYSVVMDFLTQRKPYIEELKSIKESLTCHKGHTYNGTDNRVYCSSYIDEDTEIYELQVCYSDSVDDFHYSTKMYLSKALLNVITRNEVPIYSHFFILYLNVLKFNIFNIVYEEYDDDDD